MLVNTKKIHKHRYKLHTFITISKFRKITQWPLSCNWQVSELLHLLFIYLLTYQGYQQQKANAKGSDALPFRNRCGCRKCEVQCFCWLASERASNLLNSAPKCSLNYQSARD